MAAVEFTQVVSRGCGMDIHKEVATVRGEGIQKETRSFGTFTSSLTELREWLVSLGITHVAMESTGGAVQPYRYTGKELTRFNALNWYNYGARWYDPTIARWNGVDNMAENYLGCSPYIYCGNNPISRIDVDGNDWYITGSGNIVYNPSVHSQEDIGSKDQERGYKYLGESWTDEEKGIQYRRDGSILFSNEKDAYNRM